MKQELKISSDIDLYKFSYQNLENFDHIHLDLRNFYLDENKFLDIFNKFSETKQSGKFHLDFYNVELNENKVNILNKCFQNWKDVDNLHIHFKDVKISDEDFENFLTKGLLHLSNLEKLHFIFKNINLNKQKATSLYNLIKHFPKLSDIKLNFDKNQIPSDDMESLRELTKGIAKNEIQIE